MSENLKEGLEKTGLVTPAIQQRFKKPVCGLFAIRIKSLLDFGIVRMGVANDPVLKEVTALKEDSAIFFSQMRPDMIIISGLEAAAIFRTVEEVSVAMQSIKLALIKPESIELEAVALGYIRNTKEGTDSK